MIRATAYFYHNELPMIGAWLQVVKTAELIGNGGQRFWRPLLRQCHVMVAYHLDAGSDDSRVELATAGLLDFGEGHVCPEGRAVGAV